MKFWPLFAGVLLGQVVLAVAPIWCEVLVALVAWVLLRIDREDVTT